MSKRRQQGCVEVVVRTLIDDAERTYQELEERPCRRAGSMLLRGVPVLVLLLLFVYVGASEPHMRGLFMDGASIAFLAGLYALIFALLLLWIVGSDVCRAIAGACSCCTDE